MDSNTSTNPISSRRSSNQSALDKKKRKKKKKRAKEGKRSSASSASASGSPDSSGVIKTHHSHSCPSILGGGSDENSKNFDALKEDAFPQINECLRWPAHSLYTENSFRSEVIGSFPVAGATEEEESERIAIYKMNRRKRYLSAQQALVNKYPDVAVYASSSGSSSGRDTNEDGLRISSSRSVPPSEDTKPGILSANGSPDPRALESQENIHSTYFSNEDSLAFSKNKNVARQEIFSGM